MLGGSSPQRCCLSQQCPEAVHATWVVSLHFALHVLMAAEVLPDNGVAFDTESALAMKVLLAVKKLLGMLLKQGNALPNATACCQSHKRMPCLTAFLQLQLKSNTSSTSIAEDCK